MNEAALIDGSEFGEELGAIDTSRFLRLWAEAAHILYAQYHPGAMPTADS